MKEGWGLESESCITKKMQGVHSLMGDITCQGGIFCRRNEKLFLYSHLMAENDVNWTLKYAETF